MIKVGNITIEENGGLVFILGPCIIESEKETLEIAEALLELCPFPFIFKASYDKANRSSASSYRGPGKKTGLAILKKVKETYQIPVTTDVHEVGDVEDVAEVCDLLQIPAFLCRQTDLLEKAASTTKPVHVKKGQFMSPYDMINVVEKLKNSGKEEIILTDRGASFGYNNLVSDMRAIPIMKDFCPIVCFDATHSVQLPGGLKTMSGGERRFIPTLAKCAVAAGADMIFMETHPNPSAAKSDSSTQMPLKEISPLLHQLAALYKHIREESYVSQV